MPDKLHHGNSADIMQICTARIGAPAAVQHSLARSGEMLPLCGPPHHAGAQFNGLWPCLYYDSSIKQRLLRYATSALLFSERGVSTDLVSWNR
jgi:hypothetical protein